MKFRLKVKLALFLAATTATSAFSPSSPGKEFTVLSTVQRPGSKHSRSLTRPFSTPSSIGERTTEQSVDLDSKQEEVVTQNETNKRSISRVSLKPIGAVAPAAASVFTATVGTWILNNYLDVGPIKASSIAGLIATLILPEKLAVAALCGSFAGMARIAVIPGLAASAVLGVVCAATMMLFDHKKWLVGMGGRLGFIAQCACTTQFVVSSLLMGAPDAAALIGSPVLPNPAGLLRQLPLACACTVAGAIVMRFWKTLWVSNISRLATSVGAVSATGLLASLALPASMAGPAYCGAFVAMAAPAKLPTTASLLLASILAGASQQALAGVMLGGWGGKLGTAGLMGVVSYTFLNKLFLGSKLPQPEVAMIANVKAN